VDIVQLAQHAIAHLRPELAILAAKAAESAAGETAKQVVHWFRDRVKGTPAEPALHDALTHPDDERRLTILQTQLEILLEERESLRSDLAEFLANTSHSQTAVTQGDQNKIAQVSGQGHKIQIN
jgi:hypothetical protein